MEFQSSLYHSIALELLYKSSFGSEVIGSSVRPQIPENRAPKGGAVRYVTLRLFRQFTAQRPIASTRTQKILVTARVQTGPSYGQLKWSIQLKSQLICEPNYVPRVSPVRKMEEKIPDQLRAREILGRLINIDPYGRSWASAIAVILLRNKKF